MITITFIAGCKYKGRAWEFQIGGAGVNTENLGGEELIKSLFNSGGQINDSSFGPD
jgi:hypothetical protein